MTVQIDKVVEKRDVDAALYLLGRMLRLSEDCVGHSRRRLAELENKLRDTNRISDDDRREVIESYREVVG